MHVNVMHYIYQNFSNPNNHLAALTYTKTQSFSYIVFYEGHHSEPLILDKYFTLALVARERL
jgi:hypothetical protein